MTLELPGVVEAGAAGGTGSGEPTMPDDGAVPRGGSVACGETVPAGGVTGGTTIGGTTTMGGPARCGTSALGSTQSGPLRSMHSGLASGTLCAKTTAGARAANSARTNMEIGFIQVSRSYCGSTASRAGGNVARHTALAYQGARFRFLEFFAYYGLPLVHMPRFRRTARHQHEHQS